VGERNLALDFYHAAQKKIDQIEDTVAQSVKASEDLIKQSEKTSEIVRVLLDHQNGLDFSGDGDLDLFNDEIKRVAIEKGLMKEDEHLLSPDKVKLLTRLLGEEEQIAMKRSENQTTKLPYNLDKIKSLHNMIQKVFQDAIQMVRTFVHNMIAR
jgi:hypothetical protein